MTYYDDIVRLLNEVGNLMYYYDNMNDGEPHSRMLGAIEEKINLLHTACNHQLSEFREWVTARRKAQ